MHLKKLSIANFRAVERLELNFDENVTVIVGPNAVGKTTILEAIRLCKGVLAPRIQNEAQQILISLGATSPHIPQQLQLDALARDPAKPVEINCRYELSDEEIAEIENQKQKLINTLVQSRIGQPFANPAVLVNFLSSPQGVAALKEAGELVDAAITKIKSTKIAELNLKIAPSASPFTGSDELSQLFIATLDQRLSPNRTLFSYFPADRSLPSGEPPVQLGAIDASQQLESYNSQPQLKYHRLKNTIFNAVIMSPTDRDDMETEVKEIFGSLLKGLTFVGVGVNDFGLLNITVQDESGRRFQMDGMSSGEKGLILTFLTIARSAENGGIILIDEPELHLNPAVCKDLLPFISTQYAKERNLQIILCSHSPEILASAFNSTDCGLWRIVSPSRCTKVRYQDHEVVEAALRHLGSSHSEGLLYRGVLFVEGTDDVSILEVGFNDILRRFKVIDMGGRPEIEKSIASLQESEKRVRPDSRRYFLFDRDGKPSNLVESEFVKFKQLDRHCIENYLLDRDILCDMLMSGDYGEKIADYTAASTLLKDVAFSQLDETLIRQVYHETGFPDASLKREDVSGTAAECSQKLFNRIDSAVAPYRNLDRAEWCRKFEESVHEKRQTYLAKWADDWPKICNGKRFFDDLWASHKMKVAKSRFKREAMKELRHQGAEPWLALKALLTDLLSADLAG